MKAAFGVIWNLEKQGGSLVGGAIKRFQDKKNNPDPPRDPRLPPKPKGQTVRCRPRFLCLQAFLQCFYGTRLPPKGQAAHRPPHLLQVKAVGF